MILANIIKYILIINLEIRNCKAQYFLSGWNFGLSKFQVLIFLLQIYLQLQLIQNHWAMSVSVYMHSELRERLS